MSADYEILEIGSDGSYDLTSAKPKSAPKATAPSASIKRPAPSVPTPATTTSSKPTPTTAPAPSPPSAAATPSKVATPAHAISVDLAAGEYQLVEHEGKHILLLRLAKDDETVSSIQLYDNKVEVKCEQAQEAYVVDISGAHSDKSSSKKLGKCKRHGAFLSIEILHM